MPLNQSQNGQQESCGAGQWVFYTVLPIEQADMLLAKARIETLGLAQGATVSKDIPGNEENPRPEQFTYETTMIFANKQPMPMEGEWVWLEDQDWNAVWKQSIEPIVEDGLTIIPPWLWEDYKQQHAGQTTDQTADETAEQNADKTRELKKASKILVDKTPVEDAQDQPIVMVIEPGQAFGTGHHETTMHCARAIMKHQNAFKGATVADIGTGTGILALLSSHFGARQVYAADIDSQAIATAHENIAINQRLNPHNVITLEVGSTTEAKTFIQNNNPPGYDIVIANMITPILLELCEPLSNLIAPGGFALLSGISMPRVQTVVSAYQNQGLTVTVIPGEEWAGLIATKNQ